MDVEGTQSRDSDGALLIRLRAGEPAAYAVLMRRNNQRLYRLARGILDNETEAEEAVQEAYLRAFTHLDRFKGEASLATWLARIVLNEALGRRRRHRPMADIDSLAEALPGEHGLPLTRAVEPSPEQAIARQEIRRAIERAVDALPPAFRSVFMLRALEEMSVSATAACLAIPEDTVKSRFHRANKLLRGALAAEFGPLLDGAFPFLGERCDRLTRTILARLGLAAETVFPAPQHDRPAPSRSPP